jgi:hypothetical protein
VARGDISKPEGQQAIAAMVMALVADSLASEVD